MSFDLSSLLRLSLFLNKFSPAHEVVLFLSFKFGEKIFVTFDGGLLTEITVVRDLSNYSEVSRMVRSWDLNLRKEMARGNWGMPGRNVG